MAKTTPKSKAWDQCSRYCRLRDALAYCRKHGFDLSYFDRPKDIIVKCCTCGVVRAWIYMDAGHFISRGSQGASGVYFHECNSNAQCKHCNAFYQGRANVYAEFMIEKYGPEIIEELEMKNRTNSYKGQFQALEVMFKEMYEELVRSI